jgi:hypothetical protein
LRGGDEGKNISVSMLQGFIYLNLALERNYSDLGSIGISASWRCERRPLQKLAVI